MYSFLRRPIWILSHVLIAILIVVLISLGFWQRSRYYEEKGKKDHLDAAAVATPRDIDDVVDPSTSIADVDESVQYTRVELKGAFDESNEVLINNRSLDGSPGAWILTPLVRADGSAIAVVRGWVPLSLTEKKVPVPEALPPKGNVTVTGIVQLTQVRQSFGPVDPAKGQLDHLSRVDLARFAKQLPYEIDPVWVLLDAQEPAQSSDLPSLVSLQPNDPSQNFSYMIQWWIFATIAIVGYPLVLRMVARNKESGSPRRRRRDDNDEIPWAKGLGPGGDGESTVPAEQTELTQSSTPSDRG